MKLATFNVRGLATNTEEQLEILGQDLQKYNIDIAGIQETHLVGPGQKIINKSGKIKYTLHFIGQNPHHGVGIAIRENLDANIKIISDRIIKATIKDPKSNRKLQFISAYAPHSEITKKNPIETSTFYETLEKEINSSSSRHPIFILADFNAQLGKVNNKYPLNVGKFGKGNNTTPNGKYLLELADRNKLVVTNTLFEHKPAHRTTWICPERKNSLDKDGTPRKNPYRNQIDFILAPIYLRPQITDSRSFGGFNTSTDHKLVVCKLEIKWHRVFREQNKTHSLLDVDRLRSEVTKQKYQTALEEKLTTDKEYSDLSTQEKWTNLVRNCKEVGNKVIPPRNNKRKSNNPKLIALTQEQKKIRLDIEASTNKPKRDKLKIKRRQIKKQVSNIIKEENNTKFLNQIEEIENSKNDSTRMFKAIRILQKKSGKENLIVHNRQGEIIVDDKDKISEITNFFQDSFNSKNAPLIPEIEPCALSQPFTSSEIEKAANKLKNNKSPGCDSLQAELVKYGPTILHEKIADILNEVATTGSYPEELRTGNLIPLPKPGKPKGPTKNLRPIILLSVLRKILAICIIQRTFERIREAIPSSQAAYSPGRNTTELVFAFKLLAEKAISSSNYETHLLMLDMSKAFDTVVRATLINDIKEILEPEEVHLISILVKDVKLQVKCESNIGETFTTNTGVPQGDCLSPILFTFYLSKALKAPEEIHQNDLIPCFLNEHSYSNLQFNPFTIDQQYADDIGWAAANEHVIDQNEKKIPPKLKERNLMVNEEKTERYAIRRGGSEEWKECKYLGSHLDTEKDIARRKQLANAAFNKLRSIFKSNSVSTEVKCRLFEAYISSIFLYNCEIWTLNKALENEIDVFQRCLLRKILKVYYPRTITNKYLYQKTKLQPWSTTASFKRLKWLGHVFRLPQDSPAPTALKEALVK